MTDEDLTDQEIIDWLRQEEDLRVCLSHDIRMCRVKPSTRELFAAEHMERLLARVTDLEKDREEADRISKEKAGYYRHILKLESRIAALEAALKPFADARHMEGLADWIDDGTVIGCNIQARDLRAARAAMERKDG